MEMSTFIPSVTCSFNFGSVGFPFAETMLTYVVYLTQFSLYDSLNGCVTTFNLAKHSSNKIRAMVDNATN